MGNCLSKFTDKPFILHAPPLTSGQLKKVASGIRKNPVKYFATGIHQKYRYEETTQSIKSSLIDAYERFSSHSFEYSDGGAPVIKKQSLGVSFVEQVIVPFLSSGPQRCPVDKSKASVQGRPEIIGCGRLGICHPLTSQCGKTAYISGPGLYHLRFSRRLPIK